MSALDFVRPHPDANLDETLAVIPPRAKQMLKASFSAMSTLESTKRESVVEVAIKSGLSGPIEVEDLAESIEITKERAGLLVNGASFLVAISGAYQEVANEDLLAKLGANGLLDEQNAKQIDGWLGIVRQHEDSFRTQVESNAVANEVLPSLRAFHIAIDVRLSFSSVKGRPAAVPVVIAMLDTDAEGQTIWFQMSKNELYRLQEQLNKAAKQFAVAEDLAAKA